MSIRFNIERDFKNTEIGLIPIDWQEKKLKNYCKVISGYAFKSNDFISDGILVVKISNLQNGTIIVDQKSSFFPRDKIFDEHKKFLLKEGDILIALTGATIGKVAVVPKKYEGSLLNQRVGKFLIFNDEIIREYLFYCTQLKNFREYIVGNILRSAQGNISPKNIENIIIPLPPLSEQKAIAYVLSTIQEAKEKTEAVIKATRELKKSMMKHLFTYGVYKEGAEWKIGNPETVKVKETEIGTIPEHWQVVRLGSYCKVIRGASPRPKGDPKFYGGNIPRLMVQDVTRDYKYVIPRLDYLTLEGAKKSRFLPKGTVIIQVSGNPGTPCILGIDACIHDGFAALIDLDRTKINDEFIFYYFDYSKSLYKQLAFGAIFQNLQTYSISKFLIPIPPLPEQKVIAHILQTIDDKIQKEEAKKKALENLFKSMLHNLMSGKIRVKSSME